MPTVSSPSTDPILQTQVFWVRYRNAIIAAVLVLLLALAAFGAYKFYTMRRNAAAAAQLAGAKEAPDYQKVFNDYPGTPAASSAYLLLASLQRDKQQYSEANATLQTFISKFPKHELVTSAQMAMAGNLESMNKPDDALALYAQIASKSPQSFNAPLALLAQVPILKQKGRIDEARRVCETVLTQYRESYASSEAAQYLRSLRANAPAAPAAAPSAAAPIPEKPSAPAPSATPTASAAATP
jgi:predicted negative regulator of RcsB-dependent stress response